MKLNNKGVTLTEIIISIALISIVLIFLASLLVTVNDINKESEVNSTYLIGKSVLIKNIENDLRNASSLTISECANGVKDIFTNYGEKIGEIDYFTYPNDHENIINKLQADFCYQFDYKDELGDTKSAKLGLFYYHKITDGEEYGQYIISYVNDASNTKQRIELPNFEKINVIDSSFKFGQEISGVKTGVIWNNNIENSMPTSTIIGFFTMTIPLIGDDGKDYSIIISYYGE